MEKGFDPKDILSTEELIMANAMKIDAVVELLIDKGMISEKEYFLKLKDLQHGYQVLSKA